MVFSVPEVKHLLGQAVLSGLLDDIGDAFDALRGCLGKLGENARQLIRLRYEEGQGIAEIRKSVGGKHSALTMKLHRLRDRLRSCIEDQMKEVPHG